jgi:hypothetical protein
MRDQVAAAGVAPAVAPIILYTRLYEIQRLFICSFLSLELIDDEKERQRSSLCVLSAQA